MVFRRDTTTVQERDPTMPRSTSTNLSRQSRGPSPHEIGQRSTTRMAKSSDQTNSKPSRLPRRTSNPAASSPAALARMQRQSQKDTAPELALRRELHRRGLRYRTHFAVIDQRRKHDIVFLGPRIVVEVRGCFWHGCSLHGTEPKKNADWWATKLGENRRRDADTERRLRTAGWTLVTVWEHETAEEAADAVECSFEVRCEDFGRGPAQVPTSLGFQDEAAAGVK